MSCIGSYKTTFKVRFNYYTHSFRNRNKSNATKLSKYYRNCLIHSNKLDIKWNICTTARPYKCGSGSCNLCLGEKIAIFKSTKTRPSIHDQKSYPNIDIKINLNGAISKGFKTNFHLCIVPYCIAMSLSFRCCYLHSWVDFCRYSILQRFSTIMFSEPLLFEGGGRGARANS